jgi:hypothetical protein
VADSLVQHHTYLERKFPNEHPIALLKDRDRYAAMDVTVEQRVVIVPIIIENIAALGVSQ